LVSIRCIAIIIEQKASIAGAVGGCQAETGTAAAHGAVPSLLAWWKYRSVFYAVSH